MEAKPVENTEQFVSNLLRWADKYEGQPVAIVADGTGGYRVGLMNILYPNDKDWCMKPVEPNNFQPPEDTK